MKHKTIKHPEDNTTEYLQPCNRQRNRIQLAFSAETKNDKLACVKMKKFYSSEKSEKASH